jgi:hypothetical protein
MGVGLEATSSSLLGGTVAMVWTRVCGYWPSECRAPAAAGCRERVRRTIENVRFAVLSPMRVEIGEVQYRSYGAWYDQATRRMIDPPCWRGR